MEAQASVWSGFGASLALSLASLGLVCLVAWLVIRGLARAAGRPERRPGALRVRARLALEPRRALYVVQVGSRLFLVGSSEGGLSLVAELAEADVPVETSLAAPAALSRWWQRAWAANRMPSVPSSSESEKGTNEGGAGELDASSLLRSADSHDAGAGASRP